MLLSAVKNNILEFNAVRSKTHLLYQVFSIYVCVCVCVKNKHPSNPLVFFISNITNVICNISVFAFV